MTFQELINEVAAMLGENPTTPMRWTLGEFQRASNEALKKLTGYFGDWVAEESLSLTSATDTYELPEDLRAVVSWSFEDSDIKQLITSRESLPTDGKTGCPSVMAQDRTSLASPGRRSAVFYPAPDVDYEVIVTYQYLPTLDINELGAVVPVGIDLEYPLILLTCHYLASKSTVEKNDKDQQNYLKLAMSSISTTVALEVNKEYRSLGNYL
jgi:hypothetical protein